MLACGRRWGKTTVNIRILAEHALAGETWGYFSFTYKNLAETYRELRDALAFAALRSSQTEGRIELKTGGLIEFWSLQTAAADTARGRKYDGLVLDEASYITNGEYVWNGVIRPTLADKQGGALITSTPAGANHFQEWYLRGTNETEFANWHSWHYPTSTNPAISEDEIEEIRRETPPLLFRQEYLAEFVESAGAVFGDFKHALYTPPPDDAWNPGHYYVGGLDWGNENDYSSLSIRDCEDDREVYLNRWRHMDWQSIRRNVLDACELWHVDVLAPEKNSASSNIENLVNEAQGRGLKMDIVAFAMTNERKASMVGQMYKAMHEGESKFIDRDYATAELQQFQSKQTANGAWTYGVPEAIGHDDTVIARMAALRAQNRRIG